jgi:transposase
MRCRSSARDAGIQPSIRRQSSALRSALTPQALARVRVRLGRDASSPDSAIGGGPKEQVHPRREVVNAILYVTRTGVQWRYLPHDLPDWQSVYHYFRLCKKDGTWKKVHDALRGKVRLRASRALVRNLHPHRDDRPHASPPRVTFQFNRL